MTRLAALPATLLVTGLLSARAAAGVLIVDSFTEALPANPCLPSSGHPVVFQGPYCDGTNCPPDPMAACERSFAEQSGLAGVLATARRDASVRTWTKGASSVGRIDVANHRFEVVLDESFDQWAELTYWRYDEPRLALDFIALGIESIEFSMGGDMTSERPVHVQVLFVDAPDIGNNNVAYVTRTIIAPGPISIPLSEFTFPQDFDLHSVDIIDIEFGDCVTDNCTPLSGPRAYWLGPISLDAAPVPATPVSWSGVKATYR